MRIYRVTEPSAEFEKALEKLLPQLSSSAEIPTSEYIAAMLNDKNTHLLAAEIDGATVGILSLVIVNIPTGRKAWIEDVVVDSDCRGQNIGFKLVEKAKEVAMNLGVKKIYLTSNPARQAAHRLYAKCGFEKYDTTLFRILL